MKLKVTIDFVEHAKVMHWVRKAGHLEVSGFGRVLRLGSWLHVSKVYLLTQSNTAGSTILDAAALSRAMYQTKDEPGDFNFWWHSHHSMAAFFSGTDHDTIKDLGSNGWLLATCFNNREETKTGLYTTHPIEMLYEDGVQLEVQGPALSAAAKAELDREYAAKVTELGYGSGAYPPYRKWESKKERRERLKLEAERDSHLPKKCLPPAPDLDDEPIIGEIAELLAGFENNGGYN